MYLSHLRIWPVTFLSVQHLTVTSCSVHLPEQPTTYLRQVQMQATLQAFLFLIFLRLLRFSVSKIWLLPYIFAFIHLYGINKILPFLFWYRFVYTDFYYTPFILKIPPLLLSYFYQLLKYFAQSFHCWTFCSSNNKIRLGKLKSFSQTDFLFCLIFFRRSLHIQRIFCSQPCNHSFDFFNVIFTLKYECDTLCDHIHVVFF